MSQEPILAQELEEQRQICQELLSVVEKEREVLQEQDEAARFEVFQAKKKLLPRLQESLEKVRRARMARTKPGIEPTSFPLEVQKVIRQNQDLIMRVIVMDRENEQLMLRSGLVPAKHLPPANRQKPHFVTELYRRHIS